MDIKICRCCGHAVHNEAEKIIEELKKRFRAEYEDAEAMEMEDCINWADWLDATAEQIIADRKGQKNGLE